MQKWIPPDEEPRGKKALERIAFAAAVLFCAYIWVHIIIAVGGYHGWW